jgi:CMP/dCMP kinase
MISKKNHIVIAVDGYSSCGKSTLAKQIAQVLNILYVDSGAMYRAVTLYCMRNLDFSQGVPPVESIVKLLPHINVEFRKVGNQYQTFLNGENIESEIRKMIISENVSNVSKIPEVRQMLVRIQQEMAENQSIIMDGRDIGTVVFPFADIKIFVTASPIVRAKRRFLELRTKGEEPDFEAVYKNIIDRDKMDTSRKLSPLIQAKDAILIDNSNMNQEEQLSLALSIIKEKLQWK